jgi:hypothetical protein
LIELYSHFGTTLCHRCLVYAGTYSRHILICLLIRFLVHWINACWVAWSSSRPSLCSFSACNPYIVVQGSLPRRTTSPASSAMTIPDCAGAAKFAELSAMSSNLKPCEFGTCSSSQILKSSNDRNRYSKGQLDRFKVQYCLGTPGHHRAVVQQISKPLLHCANFKGLKHLTCC